MTHAAIVAFVCLAMCLGLLFGVRTPAMMVARVRRRRR